MLSKGKGTIHISMLNKKPLRLNADTVIVCHSFAPESRPLQRSKGQKA